MSKFEILDLVCIRPDEGISGSKITLFGGFREKGAIGIVFYIPHGISTAGKVKNLGNEKGYGVVWYVDGRLIVMYGLPETVLVPYKGLRQEDDFPWSELPLPGEIIYFREERYVSGVDGSAKKAQYDTVSTGAVYGYSRDMKLLLVTVLPHGEEEGVPVENVIGLKLGITDRMLEEGYQ
ncbi:hypothetical protein [Pseudomonas phage vB_PaeM_RP7]|uniref:Uncharacterized protein n=1 Tax=Pseudomonas phage PAP-JP TaxID=2583508 RepID=A0A5C1K571_9CAUD|nr:hypothetical protein PAPJP_047 [Pseudomonas phage PAP-JP]UKH48098.1 MAG: hypothetical protein [Pseudomonas phage RP4]WAB56802.1 hypothetical protein [Pseudomonas phage vB_PaeM_RP15]WAB56916.1 hypothetical protein [Pseudomonas phage vB_PaeM_RP6]WAB57175.1 hypothetical protein [Pseudomonas phage vB_PaeM_RP7]WAB57312.1 hypothetical protein [Pseudomonas phage vB_PaeM_RP8]WAB57427.1 hypothetical protein [Pseudomonas phage vB_PaeM_RP9]WAB57715.1 hypothetical protein [Pseudomonas phage vB_PaeM_R